MRRLGIALLSFCCLPLYAQERPTFTATRTSEPPSIDGDLSDAAWQSAPEITGFTQHDPDDGKPAVQKTAIRVVYDNDAIYFGAFLHDTGPVTPLLTRRDNDLGRSDYLQVMIDSQHDRLNGAAFAVNASNVQVDMILYNDTYNDWSWDAVWESATKIVPGGWTAEIRIPYSQLRFPKRDVHTWGINFFRRIARDNAQDRLVNTPKGENGIVSRFADLTGITGITPRRGFELVPYGVARSDVKSRYDRENPFLSTMDHRLDGGMDMKYGLTSSLTLTGTINPDFGQVEVDPAVVNLSAFETFFPEKRPFFTEGSQIFSFGSGPSNSRFGFNLSFPTFFYSRRIGRSPQGSTTGDFESRPGETTILGAAKVTGKVGDGWTVGVLDALTDRETARVFGSGAFGSETVEPMTNYLVARATKEYGEASRAGFMFTSVNRRLSENLEDTLRENAYFGGIDGYTLFDEKSWLVEWLTGASLVQGSPAAIERTQNSSARYYDRPDAGHVELDPTRTSLSGYGGRITANKNTGVWRPNLQIQAWSPGFEINDVGFFTRTDAVATHAVLHYFDQKVRSRTREISAWVAKYQNWNWDGDLIANGVYGDWVVTMKNYWYLFGTAGMEVERYDDRKTRGGPKVRRAPAHHAMFGLGSDSRKKVSFEVWAEDFRSEDSSHSVYSGGSITYRPTTAVKLSLTPSVSLVNEYAQYVDTVDSRYLFAELDQTTVDLGIRAEWTVSARLSLQLFLQPFLASGEYESFKELAAGGTRNYAEFSPELVRYLEAENDLELHGRGSTLTIDNPDFNVRSVRGSAVVRWEFRPGSALYVVWNENREEVVPIGDFNLRRDFGALPNAPSDDVFLVKVSWWMPM